MQLFDGRVELRKTAMKFSKDSTYQRYKWRMVTAVKTNQKHLDEREWA